jgi:peptidoglycan/LPS O-acetylase OafA/YrhL
MTFDAATMNLSTWMWLPVIATAALLMTGADSIVASFIGAQPLRYIGNISYSLYLWHFIWLQLPLQMPFEELPSNLVLIGITGTIVCAVLSYHLLENPIRHSKKLAGNGWAVLAVLVACIAMTWIAAGWVEHLYNTAVW